ncbi:hypothetical protein BCV72DRAFT_302842 [Rhizopus microsporus var. microsporus]|uniref:Uncharacterized protein n=1 Tax=Rhizopus microsporus var. microsporus TaxID=86635 RepID=A0A1X0RC36_RHIZD|nr:hypothetical protein BCV72DRAFT_302842 [Rhizopus microsporus var. microsporus]
MIVSIKEVISELEDFIVKDYSPEHILENFKGVWLNRIGGCANLLKLELDQTKNFKYFFKKLELKVTFSNELKQIFVSNFHKLDSNRFWYLNSTETTHISVEERLFNYGLKCQYIHPIHSFIIDLGNLTLQEIFTEKELLKIKEFGSSLLVHSLAEAISLGLSKLGELNDTLEFYRAYNLH